MRGSFAELILRLSKSCAIEREADCFGEFRASIRGAAMIIVLPSGRNSNAERITVKTVTKLPHSLQIWSAPFS